MILDHFRPRIGVTPASGRASRWSVRIGLAFGDIYDLADQRIEGFLLAVAVFVHGGGVGHQHLIDHGIDGARVLRGRRRLHSRHGYERNGGKGQHKRRSEQQPAKAVMGATVLQ